MRYSAFIVLAFSFLLLALTNCLAAGSLKADTATVEIKGTESDARFVPAVVKIQPGDVIQFIVREGLHTVTAYHPDTRRPLRIPDGAKPFDSGLLKVGDTWFLQIEATGVYDYFCLPHERMGHVGRILSGQLEVIPDYPTGGIPEAALKTLTTETNLLLTKQYQ